MSTVRIYKATIKNCNGELDRVRLIKASHKSQAHSHASKGLVEVQIATTMDVAELVGDGVKVERAGEEG